ncbi:MULTISPECIES: PaaI family thioesterase [Bacillus]|uniref:PaaI family thioesterase n=1 Tax=Bacillus TaxID=1386 RepID=UPI000BB89619|nr:MULTISPECIES: PaaI family thioesterase [Bacillus]
MDYQTKWEQFLHTASETEREEASLILEALEARRNKKHSTFVSALLNFTTINFCSEKKTLEMTMTNSTLLDNSLSILHGGFSATFLDTAMGTLASKICPEGKTTVTSEIKVNFLRPGVAKDFTCTANVIHQGSKLIVVEGKMTNEANKIVAHATGSFFVIDKK